jgi:hypothetical protein
MSKLFSVCSGIVLLSFSLLVAQSSERRNMSADRSSSPSSPTVTSAPAPAPRVVSPPSGSSAAGPADHRYRMPTGVRLAPSAPPLQDYSTTAPSTKEYYHWYGFYDRLRNDFGLEYRWLYQLGFERFWYGDSPLTQPVLTYALADSNLAAEELVERSLQLQDLVRRYDSGLLQRDEFRIYAEQTVKRIRTLAKELRKDRYLDYIDLGHDIEKQSFQTVSSLPELTRLADQLAFTAQTVRDNLHAYTEQNMTRTVSVGQLQRPSVESLSKNLERLAQTMEKSFKRL